MTPPLRVVLGLWAVLLALTLTLSVLAAEHDTLPGDKGITSSVQDWPFPGQDVSDAIRAVTGTEVVLATGAAAALVLWLRGYRRQALLLAAGLAVLPVMQFAVKEIVDRPRPTPELVDIRAGFDSPGFPSGHVSAATFLYGFLVYLSLTLPLARPGRWALTLGSLAIVALGSLANVYLGVHWPSDVLGGWAWALVLLVPLCAADRWFANLDEV